VWLHQDTAMVF
jgi:HK97 family phage major capsid protein